MTADPVAMQVSSSLRPAPRRWPWAVAVLTLAMFLVACVIYPDVRTDPTFIAVWAPIVSAFVLVGALLAARVPANPIGRLLLFSGVALASTVAAGSLATVAASGGAPTWLLGLAMHLNEIGFVIPIVVVLIGIPLIFPDGRLLSPRWRWIVVLA